MVGPPVILDDGINAMASHVAQYPASPPSIDALSPVVGLLAGGTVVKITGTNLDTVTRVTWGGDEGSDPVFNQADDSITVETPAHAAGAVNVVVTNPDSSATALGGFTYGAAVVEHLQPDFGAAAGGTTVVITGQGLGTVTGVTFGGSAGVNLDADPATDSVTVDTPAHATGVVNVVVTNPDGSVTATGAYVYV